MAASAFLMCEPAQEEKVFHLVNERSLTELLLFPEVFLSLIQILVSMLPLREKQVPTREHK